ncbi:polymer-forming cytoskeletal protein [Rhodocaloribacter litoris]|uniref:bactofilin family protein n=1 Tax=Rhodocaloribacter litoris TaxID=2558931 RepID=UPI00141EE2EF|nr:polymer-forming cytoskeletal protein [Rhodocaloribacter litoris]QXD13993.1 polymer-forming cytoskeletal protein [Rhodocaloribacter litoris]GIV60822.1 MAG: hypothetical protein KatS3mg043_1911 [Rhodothermaceae bacterium]
MALFSNNKEQPMARQGNTPSPAQINMIGEGTVFEGTLRASGDVRVSGRIVGKLIVEGKALVAPEGTVEGELTATNADVAGRVEGQVQVRERLVLRGSAHIEGDVTAARLVVEEGATFDGTCKMGQLSPEKAATLKRNGDARPPAEKTRDERAT